MGTFDEGYYNAPVDFWLEKAIKDIRVNYGKSVSLGQKSKDLLKFGRNPAVGTTVATVMDLPAGVTDETYIATNGITTVSSSSASDTRQIVIEGNTISGSNLTFVTQTATLTGQSQVTLGTALARCTRVYADESSTTDLVGNVYVYENDTSTGGVPDTSSKVHLIVPAGENQSRKAATSISQGEFWIVMDFDADCYEKTSAFAEVRLEIRREGGVFRPAETLAVNAGAHADHHFVPYLIIPPNSDVRLRAVADGASTDIGGMIQGTLLKVI